MSLATQVTALATRIAAEVKARGLPASGTTGQVLKKAAAGDYAAAWGVLTAADVGAASRTQGGAEATAPGSATTGTVTLNCATASVFTITPTGNITLAATGLPASGTSCTIRVRVAQGATPRTVTMPTGTLHWFTDQPTQTANKVTTYTLETLDAGANWDVYAGVEK